MFWQQINGNEKEKKTRKKKPQSNVCDTYASLLETTTTRCAPDGRQQQPRQWASEHLPFSQSIDQCIFQ
jgi:hypothetical protein